MKEIFLMRMGLFFVVDLCSAIDHPMHGHLLGLPVRAVRLLMVFRARSFVHDHRLWQNIPMELVRSEHQHNSMFHRILNPHLLL